jgi:hypothetical protein
MRQKLSRVGVVFELIIIVVVFVSGGGNSVCRIRGHFRLSFSRLFALEFGQGIPNGFRFSSIGGFLQNSQPIGEEKTGRAKEKKRRREQRPWPSGRRRFFLRGDAGIVVEFHEERRRKQFFHVHRLGQRILPVVIVVVACCQSSRQGLSHFSFIAFGLPPVDERTGRTRHIDSRLFQISSV